MAPITTLSRFEHAVDRSGVIMRARLTIPNEPDLQLQIKSCHTGSEPRIEVFLPIALIVAAKFGGALRVDGPLSEPRINAAAKVARILHLFRLDGWNAAYPRFHPVSVEAEHEAAGTVAAPGYASFYSGGADSMFSLIEHRSELSHLVFITNWEGEFSLSDSDRVARRVQDVADRYQKRLIQVWFAPRERLRTIVSWHFLHGAVLHSVAIAHRGLAGRVLIPSSYSVNELEPWGSHPLLDPCWSVPEQKILHDRVDVTRIEKLDSVLSDPFLAQRMRVCWEPTEDCGVCGKCLRTRLISEILGRQWLPNSQADARLMGPADMEDLPLRSVHDTKAFLEVRDYLEDRKIRSDLRGALEARFARVK